jgi:hypothetical protein
LSKTENVKSHNKKENMGKRAAESKRKLRAMPETVPVC